MQEDNQDTSNINVTIAKFMGIQPICIISENESQTHCYIVDVDEQGVRNIPKYNEDWNALMPVVEKINKRDWVTIYNDECKIHSLVVGEFEDIDVINEGEPLIKSVYEAVFKYIEWYNKNN